MPPRKTDKHKGLVVLNLYSPREDRLTRLWIKAIFITYTSRVRILLPGEDDPAWIFVNDDGEIVYKGHAYSDFSVEPPPTDPEELAKIEEFDQMQLTY